MRMPIDLGDALGVVQVQANRDGLLQCLQLTDQVCQHLAVGEEDHHALRLAVEEACSNVIAHGYAGSGAGAVCLSLHLVAPDLLEARLCDQAPPFFPDDIPAPDLLSAAADRPVGGLGWFFIRQLMTEVRYDSQPEGNCLFLRRRLAVAPAVFRPGAA